MGLKVMDVPSDLEPVNLKLLLLLPRLTSMLYLEQKAVTLARPCWHSLRLWLNRITSRYMILPVLREVKLSGRPTDLTSQNLMLHLKEPLLTLESTREEPMLLLIPPVLVLQEYLLLIIFQAVLLTLL